MLVKRSKAGRGGSAVPAVADGSRTASLSRREFLRRSGLTATGLTAAASIEFGMVRPASGQEPAHGGDISRK